MNSILILNLTLIPFALFLLFYQLFIRVNKDLYNKLEYEKKGLLINIISSILFFISLGSVTWTYGEKLLLGWIIGLLIYGFNIFVSVYSIMKINKKEK